jgi:hypothetical protein
MRNSPEQLIRHPPSAIRRSSPIIRNFSKEAVADYIIDPPELIRHPPSAGASLYIK